MRKLFFILLTPFLFSFTSDKDVTKRFIEDYFDSSFQFVCSDENSGKVEMSFLHSKFDPKTVSFKTVVPDSLVHSDFYRNYMNRITDVYYLYLNSASKNDLSNILNNANCELEGTKEKVKTYFCNDSVFYSVFKVALESYYSHSDKKEELNIGSLGKKVISIEELVEISLLQFDIVSYDPKRGFGYHFLCGVNPFSYHIKNKENLLLPGFCIEALKNEEMRKVHTEIMKDFRQQVKLDYMNEKDNVKGMCKRYQDKLRKRLLKDGTIKQCLLNHYEKNKDVEPFELSAGAK